MLFRSGGAIVGALLVRSVGLAWPLALIGAVTLLATLAYVAHPAAGEGSYVDGVA